MCIYNADSSVWRIIRNIYRIERPIAIITSLNRNRRKTFLWRHKGIKTKIYLLRYWFGRLRRVRYEQVRCRRTFRYRIRGDRIRLFDEDIGELLDTVRNVRNANKRTDNKYLRLKQNRLQYWRGSISNAPVFN